MNTAFLKQDIYPAPIDGLFIVKCNTDSNSPSIDEKLLDLIGYEFTLEFTSYKIITIMQDIITSEYFALCKNIPSFDDINNIAHVG